MAMAAAWVAATVRADVGGPTMVQDFVITTPVTAYDPDPAPDINKTWSILKWNGLPSDLLCVTVEITNRLMYNGTLVSLVGNLPYNLQVRSDFAAVFGAASPGTQNGLDPEILLSGTTPEAAGTQFPASNPPTTTAASGASFVITGAGVADYNNGGTTSVTVTGSLLTSPLTGYHNISDGGGTPSPATFVDAVKVFPVFNLQLYQLETTLRVTYYLVPEGEVPATAMLGCAVGWVLWRRKKV